MYILPTTTLLAIGWFSVASASVAVTGVKDGVISNGARPTRLNINTLQTDKYAWPLYIQALAAMQSDPQTSPSSYFEISGIHGRPYKDWDNVHGTFDTTGYCTHDSILFPSWHRPYLALFEQSLSSKAESIALQYQGNDKVQYQTAAKSLRIPYWDWAASSAIPDIASKPKITIVTPKGSQQINNPLYSYQLPTLDPKYFPKTGAEDSYLATTPKTVRDPNANDNLAQAGIKTATYNLFSRISDYSTFATQKVSGSSLEVIHGDIHGAIGGEKGHMSQISYAAYDPIFWLHHANVDRVFALWQATHPNAYIPAQGLSNEYGTHTIAPGTVDTITSGLTPFVSSNGGAFHNSNTARQMSTFGYTYPEISDWNQTPAQLASSVTAKINALYKPSGGHKRHARDISAAQETEWFCLISVDKFALGSSFSVLLFLGDPPADASTWKRASNLAGSLFVNTPPVDIRAPGSMTTHSEISLKPALDNAALPDNSEAAVAQYLTKNLQWRVQKTDYTVINPSEAASLNISVQVEEVTPPVNDYSFPTYSNPTPHPEITQGRNHTATLRRAARSPRAETPVIE